MSILIVDDNSTVLDSLSVLLSSRGYSIDTACNGLDASNKCRNANYDLILVDHLMPIMDGIQFSKKLRQLPQFQNTPIIFMTTQGCASIRHHLSDGLFNQTIDKPIDENLLITSVNSFISTNSRQCSL